MIFMTTGTQLPFDRLLMAMDRWAQNNPEAAIYAQVGQAKYTPKEFKYQPFMDSCTFNAYLDKASLIIAHAGIGTIINALIQHKPIILFPRRYEFNEHRNDHQLGTARKFESVPGCHVAWDESQLLELLENREGLVSGHLNENHYDLCEKIHLRLSQL